MKFLKNAERILLFGVLFLFLIPNFEAQTKKLKRPNKGVGVSSLDRFVGESFDIYDKVHMYDGYAEAGTAPEDKDIDVLEEALDDLEGLNYSAPDIFSIGVITQKHASC
ncbi:hypothetical protein SAMN05421824_2858 [Hyunsoonleella jejuensis]|uniref:Uncharacterized protein n=1 Tax=Hyunsoonleella jejuensis TaxID=419940 RepID=A0A1H9KXA0_9FLAO|nr:hypothetical protein [Hyunsoonleella jejuensis]SER03792.1 hypothetical protein SAMN05421824_2858 [Hyunsoonleella jejuensis]